MSQSSSIEIPNVNINNVQNLAPPNRQRNQNCCKKSLRTLFVSIPLYLIVSWAFLGINIALVRIFTGLVELSTLDSSAHGLLQTFAVSFGALSTCVVLLHKLRLSRVASINKYKKHYNRSWGAACCILTFRWFLGVVLLTLFMIYISFRCYDDVSVYLGWALMAAIGIWYFLFGCTKTENSSLQRTNSKLNTSRDSVSDKKCTQIVKMLIMLTALTSLVIGMLFMCWSLGRIVDDNGLFNSTSAFGSDCSDKGNHTADTELLWIQVSCWLIASATGKLIDWQNDITAAWFYIVTSLWCCVCSGIIIILVNVSGTVKANGEWWEVMINFILIMIFLITLLFGGTAYCFFKEEEDVHDNRRHLEAEQVCNW